MTTIRPPRWAESLFQILLPVERQESVIGDLLEEYREAKVPNGTERRADMWYVGQLGAAFWRIAGFFCIAALFICVTRELMDHFVPVSVPGRYNERGAVAMGSLILCYAGAGFWAAWRTGRIFSGVLSAIAACIVGWSGTIAIDQALTILRVPSVNSAIEIDRTGRELLVIIPVLILALMAFAAVLGLVGATLGTALRRLPHLSAGQSA